MFDEVIEGGGLSKWWLAYGSTENRRHDIADFTWRMFALFVLSPDVTMLNAGWKENEDILLNAHGKQLFFSIA
jgi:hypothetical protein